ncbi:MAG: hypothetical protein ACHRXM_11575 [Isosphaerales bacterium]
MRQARRAILEGLLLIGGITLIGAPAAQAQMGTPGAGRSLGGYGEATIGRYYSSGMTSYMPYNGSAGGFIPYRGGYAGGFGFEPISRRVPQTPIGGISMPMTPIGGASLSGGMGAGAGRGVFAPFGYEGGIGLGAGMIGTPMTKQGGRRSPLGPGFGYPFRTPSNLAGDAAGMAVMAP